MRRRIQVVRSVGVVLALVASVTVLTSTAQARPIGCGSVVTRSVVLTRDLLGCQGDGLVIGASGITVNLGGHTVAGLVSDDSVGIRNAGHADVLVKNGVVRQFERGVQLTGVSGNRLRGLTVELNGSDGIDLNHSNGTQVLGGTIRDNFTGVLLENGSAGNIGGVFVLSDSDRTLLQDNTVANDRPGDGIFVEAGSDRTVLRRNLASLNGDDGIQVDDPDTLLVGNTANDNDDLGIEAVAGVTDGGGNTASGNGNPAQCINVHCT